MNGISGISFQETKTELRVNVSKSKKITSSGTMKKRLPYNFKQLSRQISQAKTSDAARPLVNKIRSKLSWLYKKLRTGEYGDSEISAAIVHAAAMERIAKRKVRHLEEEENAENGGTGAVNSPGEEEEEVYGKDELKESLEENEEITEEKMKQMMAEIERLEDEFNEDMMSELKDMISCAGKDMSEDEIKEFKRRHREDEDRQLMKADLKYMKALFDRLEQEKKQAGYSGLSSGENTSSSFSMSVDCVPEIEMAEPEAGSTVDINA